MAGTLSPLPAGQTRDALIIEVAQALATVPVDAAVVIALSGGPDSSALAHLVVEARADLTAHLVHVRHGLRDDQRDVAVVRTHAAWLDAPLTVLDVEVVPDGRGTEAAARDQRYAALRTAALEVGAYAILVGHTADDQAETLLLRLARGTGIDGLGGMESVSADLIRPLLRIRRDDVHRFVALEGLPHAEDPTNEDPEVRRAVVRHQLLPVLREVAPDPVGALVRLAELARDDVAALDAAAAVPLASVRSVGPVHAIPESALGHLEDPAALAIARRVVREVLGRFADDPPDAATVARVLALAPGSAASLPGPVEVTAAGGWRAFSPRSLPRSDRREVRVPGTTAWPPIGAEVVALVPGAVPDATSAASRAPATEQASLELPGAWMPPAPDPTPALVPPGSQPTWLTLNLPDRVGRLSLRHREPGDQITTAGGTRSLQDVLVDAGVPRPVRDLWPVVVDATDRLVWVPGYAAADDLLRAGRTAPACQLRLVGTSATGGPSSTRAAGVGARPRR